MAELAEAHAALAAALAPLYIELGPEVLALWRDRELRGQDPLPVEAIRRLAECADRIVRQRTQ